jgi:hypothetical protein
MRWMTLLLVLGMTGCINGKSLFHSADCKQTGVCSAPDSDLSAEPWLSINTATAAKHI